MIANIIKKIEKTHFNKIESYLHYVYGAETGRTLFFNFSIKLEELYDISNFDSIIKSEQAFKYILPVIALYRTFIEKGMDKTVAKNSIKSYFLEYDKKDIDKFSKFIKTVFYYSIFDRKIKKFQEKKLPTKEFDIKWEEFNLQRVYFNVNKCMYIKILDEYGEKDLIDIFCVREKNMFSKINSKIDFNLKETLANGNQECKFRFFKKESR